MGFVKTTVVLGATLLTATVQGHGKLCKFTAGGKTYQGVNAPTPEKDELDIGWHSSTEIEDFTGGSYQDIQINRTLPNNLDFNCGRRYTPGPAHAVVEAGSTVTTTWCGWGTNHRGAIYDYIAACNGDCDKADLSQLQWIKIGELGLIEPDVIPHPDNDRWEAGPDDGEKADRDVGYWATDLLDDLSGDHGPDGWESAPDHTMMRDSPWAIEIPKNIKPGKYILRTEIYAHFGGTQLYPRCVNLDIVGNGTDAPAGTTYQNLYNFTDPSSTVWFQDKLSNMTLQGPALYSEAANPNPNLALGNKAVPGPDIAISAVQASRAYSSVASSVPSSASTGAPSKIASAVTGTSKMATSPAKDAQYTDAPSMVDSSPESAMITDCPEVETTYVTETVTVTV